MHTRKTRTKPPASHPLELLSVAASAVRSGGDGVARAESDHRGS